MSVNPVLLAFALGMVVVVLASLAVEAYRTYKVVGDGGRTGVLPLPVPAPDQPASDIPVSEAGTIDAGGVPSAASVIYSGQQGVDDREGVRVGGSSRTPEPVATTTEDLGHGVTKVTNWWTISLPYSEPYYLTDWTVSYTATTITYDVYGWAPKATL